MSHGIKLDKPRFIKILDKKLDILIFIYIYALNKIDLMN